MDTEKEDILIAIYINLINMVNAVTGHLPTFKSFLQEIMTSKKDKRNILVLQTALLANDKYEVAKRKPIVVYDSRRVWACNFIQKEALAQVLSCKFCEIFKNTFLTEHLWTTASMTLKYEILIVRRSHQRCSIKKSFLKIFTKFTGKHLCQSPFFIKVSGVSLQH